MLRAVYQSVFEPDSLLENSKGLLLINKYGWGFIIIRWLYYSIIFFFRDYHGAWRPFVPPPFGLDLDTYALLQRSFALPFGIFLMLILSLILSGYLESKKKDIPLFIILNILGLTFFLPFVLVQPIDQLIILTIGWKLVPVTLVHTVIALWESYAAMRILSRLYDLESSEKFMGTVLLVVGWILITGLLWR